MGPEKGTNNLDGNLALEFRKVQVFALKKLTRFGNRFHNGNRTRTGLRNMS